MAVDLESLVGVHIPWRKAEGRVRRERIKSDIGCGEICLIAIEMCYFIALVIPALYL